MIERIEDMPSGAIGLRAGGRLSKEEYVQVLEPALREAVDSGELRLLFLLTDFEGLERSAYAEDMKTGLRAWIRDHSTWKRFALVTDSEWVAKAMHMFAWMTPGEVRIYEPNELDEAKAWVAGR